jgi:hypothetical protein
MKIYLKGITFEIIINFLHFGLGTVSLTTDRERKGVKEMHSLQKIKWNTV